MLKNTMTKRFNKMVVKSVILMAIPMILLGIALFMFPETLREILILAGLFLLLDMLVFSILNKRFSASLKGMKVSVTGIDQSYPYPESFRVTKINTLKSNFNAYSYKNMQIPKSFIQSRVDYYYHLYPALDQINEINEYKLVEVSAFKYALIEDVNKKRWISSFQYLEESKS